MSEPRLQRTPRYAVMVDGRLRLELGVFRKKETAREVAQTVAAHPRRPRTATVRHIWIAT